jgi:hypothetical protein
MKLLKDNKKKTAPRKIPENLLAKIGTSFKAWLEKEPLALSFSEGTSKQTKK